MTLECANAICCMYLLQFKNISSYTLCVCVCFSNSNRHFCCLADFCLKVSFTDPLKQQAPNYFHSNKKHIRGNDWVRFMFQKPILNFRFFFSNKLKIFLFFFFTFIPHLKFISRMQTFKFPIENAIHINFYSPRVESMSCVCVWWWQLVWVCIFDVSKLPKAKILKFSILSEMKSSKFC